jgi:hypothetical protein
MYYRANDVDAKAVADWALMLSSTDDSRIQVAQRRILSALSQRSDPVDGFVDAIVAWENLFGSREGELRFRITMAMASLLAGSVEERLTLQDRLKKLYDERSAVVHGGKELNSEEAREQRNTSLSLVLAALRRLYRDFPQWINDPDRARKIVLSL